MEILEEQIIGELVAENYKTFVVMETEQYRKLAKEKT